MNEEVVLVPGSYRDPSGFLFFKSGKLYRQINSQYKENYEVLRNSGLLQRLTAENLLIPHTEQPRIKEALNQEFYKVIKPDLIETISYPYEWSFSQLKDAAIHTLKLQLISLEYGMSLKDASAYNIQFDKGKPIFIDSLSFEKYVPNKPWDGYRQFCQHFLAPLALISHIDSRFGDLSRLYIDGVPLDLASKLLPGKTKLSFGLLAHIHLHSKSQASYAGKEKSHSDISMSLLSQQRLIVNLISTVNSLKWSNNKTEWGNYYQKNNYNDKSFRVKKKQVESFLHLAKPKKVMDLGGNTGVFSRLVVDMGIPVVSIDNDPAAVETNYLEVKRTNETKLLPLRIDITNPSPSQGWDLQERSDIFSRVKADTILALALIHHLAIGNNIPFESLSNFMARHAQKVIIEFVPKEDSQVKRLLASRADIFPQYNQKGFESAFMKDFSIVKREPISGSQRILYLLQRRGKL